MRYIHLSYLDLRNMWRERQLLKIFTHIGYLCRLSFAVYFFFLTICVKSFLNFFCAIFVVSTFSVNKIGLPGNIFVKLLNQMENFF